MDGQNYDSKTTLSIARAVKTKAGLIASYDIRPGNREGIFWFRHFINMSHLLTYDTYLLTYLWSRTHTGPKIDNISQGRIETSIITIINYVFTTAMG